LNNDTKIAEQGVMSIFERLFLYIQAQDTLLSLSNAPTNI